MSQGTKGHNMTLARDQALATTLPGIVGTGVVAAGAASSTAPVLNTDGTQVTNLNADGTLNRNFAQYLNTGSS